MQAYIYARFSTLEQSKGSSLSRQLDDCRAFCDRHGWQRSQDRELLDEGRSAFDGANRAHGSALATFESDALAGRLPRDAILVVERLDRLSRQSAVDVFQLITLITDAGVAVATVDGERVYKKGSFNFASLIELIVKAQVSHEESDKKSQRIAAAWAKKRQRIAGGDKRALTKCCPAWVAVDPLSGRYVLRADRVPIIRKIFELTTCGMGKHLIARRLNEEGVLTWGRGNKGWHPSYIQRIVSSRAVIGEWQPHRKIAGVRVPEGQPLRDYFPAALDEATFARAQADRAGRTSMRGRRGRRISNLIAGIPRCGACGAAMTFRNKGKRNEKYLVCDGALRGMGCQFTTHFNYPALEAGIIDQTLHLALDDRHFPTPVEAVTLVAEHAEKQRLLSELEQRQRRLVDLLSRFENAEIEQQLRDVAMEIGAVKVALPRLDRQLMEARGAVSPKENITRIRNVLAELRSVDDGESVIARATVQQALRALIRSITCDPREWRVQVKLECTTFVLDRAGKLVVGEGDASLGLASLLSLRERGWVVTKYRDHPALGRRKN